VRRATFALLGTAIGTTLLVGAKLGTPSPESAIVAGPADESTDGGADVAPDATAQSPLAGTPGQTPTPTTLTQRTPAPGRTTAAPGSSRTTPAAPKTTAAAGGLRNGTFTGGASTNKYGTIQVTITVSGGKITDVSATYPTSPEETASINSRAIPKLRQEALAAQSAKIATVSGASYTSASYKVSLQSALDRARA
jgi:uncharacterized protein with FMN-binding domain